METNCGDGGWQRKRKREKRQNKSSILNQVDLYVAGDIKGILLAPNRITFIVLFLLIVTIIAAIICKRFLFIFQSF